VIHSWTSGKSCNLSSDKSSFPFLSRDGWYGLQPQVVPCGGSSGLTWGAAVSGDTQDTNFVRGPNLHECATESPCIVVLVSSSLSGRQKGPLPEPRQDRDFFDLFLCSSLIS
jgi:hypothetical protein